MEKVDVKFGEWIEEGFNLYKNNFGTLVLACVIALVLSTVTIGILTGPMIAGLIIVTLQLLRKEHPKPDAGKVFRGFDYFLTLSSLWLSGESPFLSEHLSLRFSHASDNCFP